MARDDSMRTTRRFLAPLASLAAALAALLAPASADDWTTIGADAQRSGWVRADLKISAATVAGGDFRFLWNMPTSNRVRSGHGLSVPVLLDFLISHRGFRSLAFVGGSDGGVFTIDTDLARMEWERHFAPGSSATTPECPGGMTTSVTRETSFAMPSMLGIGARGRRTPARSGVGNPGEGAVTLAALAASRPAPPRPATTPAQKRTRPPARPALRGVTLVHAIPASGELHSLYASNGRDHATPMAFLPANSNARGLTVSDGAAFVVTANECADVPVGVWSLDLETGTVRAWESDGGAIAGSAGMAFDPGGTVYAATKEGSLVALDHRSLSPKLRSAPVGFRSSPVVFEVAGVDHVAAITAEGSVNVYAAARLAQPVATARLDSEVVRDDAALAAWKDSDETSWILAPDGDSLTAWKLTGELNGLTLEGAWRHTGLGAALPPIVVNGVAFVLDAGSATANARLHALNARTGEVIWDSGDAIQASASGNVLSSGPGHVYLTALDNSVYAFGFPMEH